MSWHVKGQPVSPLGILDPIETLYEFDGPRVFTSRDAEGFLLLAYVCDESALGSWLLVVPTAEQTVGALKEGQVTLFEALHQPWAWLVSRDNEGKTLATHRTELSSVPERNLPQRGARLTGEGPLVRIRLSGSGIGRANVPASVARRGMDAVTTGLKSVFDFVQGRAALGRPNEEFRKLYDLPLTYVAFNSFEVAFGQPEAGLGDEQTIADASELLRNAIRWVEGEGGELPHDDVTSSVMLRALEKLAPPLTGLVEKVELSGSMLSRSPHRPISLTRVATKRIRAAIGSITAEREELITLHGVISQFDKVKASFTLREIAGQTEEQKCMVADDSLYDEAFDRFVDNERVVIVGRRTRGRSEAVVVIAIQRA